MEAGQRRFSHKALIGAIIIFYFRDCPVFSLPFKLLECLQTLDQQLMEWRRTCAAGGLSPPPHPRRRA